MNEADRIRALRDEGRIDGAQAERLLAALGALDEDRPRTAPPGEARAGPGAAAATAGATTSASAGAATAGSGSAVQGAVDRWVRVELLAADLEVRIDPSLDAPVAEADDGEVEVEVDGGTWRGAQRPRGGGSWVDRLVGGMKRGDLRLRLPARTGVELDVKAGDVDLRDVPALRGRLLAGDLEARGLRAVDLALEVGDLDVELDPIAGRHRIRMSVGEAGVRLPRDGHVEVTGRVSVGDVRAREPFRTTRSTVAERVQGRLGDGRATLSVEVGTGTIDLEVR